MAQRGQALARAAASAPHGAPTNTPAAWLTGGTLFEELGFYYVGPIDGHDLDQLLPVLRNLRDAEHDGPMLLHVRHAEGQGLRARPRPARDKYHGVQKFDVITGEQAKAPPERRPPTPKVFANALIAEAERDDRIVAITAAMPSGTGLDMFAERFPSRCFDVGIAEQHAVTFAAGLAARGHEARSARSIPPSCSAPTTRSCTTWRCRTCRCASPSTAPGWSARTARPMPGAFDIAYLGSLPGHGA